MDGGLWWCLGCVWVVGGVGGGRLAGSFFYYVFMVIIVTGVGGLRYRSVTEREDIYLGKWGKEKRGGCAGARFLGNGKRRFFFKKRDRGKGGLGTGVCRKGMGSAWRKGIYKDEEVCCARHRDSFLVVERKGRGWWRWDRGDKGRTGG